MLEIEDVELRAGNGTVKFTSNAFRGLWSDMGVEMSVIKDNKSRSDVISKVEVVVVIMLSFVGY